MTAVHEIFEQYQGFEHLAYKHEGLDAAVGRLRQRAMVSTRHYSTHPYSSDALFSVLSGTYPHGRRLLLQNLAAREVRGLFSALPPLIVASGPPGASFSAATSSPSRSARPRAWNRA